MLTELLALLEDAGEEIDVLDLGRRLGSPPSAVAGMIDTLVQMGRLEEIDFACGPCIACGVEAACPFSARPLRLLRADQS